MHARRISENVSPLRVLSFIHSRNFVRFTLVLSFLISFFIFINASSLTRRMGESRVTIDGLGARASGSVNTRIYVTSVEPNVSATYGDIIIVQGYVTVANLSNPPNWDPWPDVSVALKMNDSFMYDSGLIVNTTTDNNGNYTLSYTIPNNQSAGYWNVTVGLSPIPDYNYTHDPNFSGTIVEDLTILIKTSINATLNDPIWKDEDLVIYGYLTEQSPFSGSLTNQIVDVHVMNGTTLLGTHSFTTNLTGGYYGIIPAQNVDNLTYSVVYSGDSSHDSCSVNGTVNLYNSARFEFDPGMVTFQYAGMAIRVFGNAFQKDRDFGIEVPLESKDFNVYWDGAFLEQESTDEDGVFDFTMDISSTESPGIHALRLEVDVQNMTSQDISSTYNILVKQIGVILDESMDDPVFPNKDYVVEGQINPARQGISIVVDLHYRNGSFIRYDGYGQDNATLGSMTTNSEGRFYFKINGSFITSELRNITVVVNPYNKGNFGSGTNNTAITFITAIYFVNLTASSKTQVIQGRSFLISGVIVSQLGAPVREQDVVINYVIGTHNYSASFTTNKFGQFSGSIIINGTPGQHFTYILIVNASTSTQYKSESFELTIVEPPNSSWVLWLIPPIIVGFIFLGVLYTKYSKKKELQEARSFMQQKMDVLRMLVNNGRYKEAISYCYQIFVQVTEREFDLDLDDLGKGITIREFMDLLVREKGVPAELAWKFNNMLNEGLYSHYKVTRKDVSSTVETFGILYKEITGDISERFEL
ncbi:MAG: hypothetical protein ACTSVI_07575 [Promethearchaeota archaeon]